MAELDSMSHGRPLLVSHVARGSRSLVNRDHPTIVLANVTVLSTEGGEPFIPETAAQITAA